MAQWTITFGAVRLRADAAREGAGGITLVSSKGAAYDHATRVADERLHAGVWPKEATTDAVEFFHQFSERLYALAADRQRAIRDGNVSGVKASVASWPAERGKDVVLVGRYLQAFETWYFAAAKREALGHGDAKRALVRREAALRESLFATLRASVCDGGVPPAIPVVNEGVRWKTIGRAASSINSHCERVRPKPCPSHGSTI